MARQLCARALPCLRVYDRRTEAGGPRDVGRLPEQVYLTHADTGAGDGRYRALFEQARDAMFITDVEGGIQEANEAAAALMGVSAAALRGRSLESLFADPADGVLLRELVQGRTAAQGLEMRVERADAAERWCVVSLAPRVGPGGEALGFHGLVIDITARKQVEDRLLHDALHDTLTGLPNRALFMDRLNQSLARWRRHPSRRCAVLFLDLDSFKSVNDTLGHAAGDALLVGVAQALLACMRGEDTVARLGGDEFAILLDAVETDADAVRAAERVQERLQEPVSCGDAFLLLSTSIGIAFPEHSGQVPADVLRNADIAMYRAKALGPSRFEVFTPASGEAPVTATDLEADLRLALTRSEFVLQYQPILSMPGGQVAGLEALIRWRHPRLGALLPDQFLGLAERVGLATSVGEWVLREACRQARAIVELVPRGGRPFVAVNLAARQLMLPELPDLVAEILHEERVPGRMLSLEIAESALTENPAAASATLRRLRAIGVRICVHDFGTGQLAIPNLPSFPVDSLKIDRSFVSRLSAGSEARALVQAIVQLAVKLRIAAAAEGVETGEQLERIRSLRPTYVQGYLFSRPVDAGAASAMVANAFGRVTELRPLHGRRPTPSRRPEPLA
jgi:diguanylate cyclase (GGDEF)-like protein/PAS domain S-box-containing protein